jgi:hypothetical protein
MSMNGTKKLAFLILVFSVFIAKNQPVMASVNCGGGSCYPPYGMVVEAHCYITNHALGCTNAEELCVDFCDDDGVDVISCDGSPANGICFCGNPYTCQPCQRDPQDCDPQTPLNSTTCECQGTPIIIDADGAGIELTNIMGGVEFNFTGKKTQRMAWTRPNVNSGFLVLDRNRDGEINDGREMFGSSTQQPQSDTPNGFKALAVFDAKVNGGNVDGWIDKKDRVFRRLQVWIDLNHDGVSATGELKGLVELGIKRIGLSYETSEVSDSYSNLFRFRAPIVDSIDRTRWVWDVMLSIGPTTTF